jgi:hypothetical protein
MKSSKHGKRTIGPSKYAVCEKYTARLMHKWLVPIYEDARAIAAKLGAIVTPGSNYERVTGLKRPPLELFLEQCKIIQDEKIKSLKYIRHCGERFTRAQAKDAFMLEDFAKLAALAKWQTS